MNPLQKAQNLRQAYAVLDPLQPLEGELLDRFYAERPEGTSIDPLIQELLLDPRDDDKTLFTGHRGNGKTTELARLERELQTSHTVVRLDVEEVLNLGDVDYADLLVVLGLEVYKYARNVGVNVNSRKVDNLRFWYQTHICEQEEIPRLESEVGLSLRAAIADLTVKFRTDTPRRQTVRAQAHAYLSDLLERLNELLQALKEATGRRTLVIVDGLDKMYNLNQVSDLYCQGANALLEPYCRAIYTVPIALYHTNDLQQVRLSFHRNFSLPNIKVWERDGNPCKEGQDALKQVLEKRMKKALIESEAMAHLVEMSGGLLKELIALARNSVLRARYLRGEKGPIRKDDVEYAALQVRNTYRSILTKEQYDELVRIYRGGQFINSPLVRELLHNLSLLEYNGEGIWWAIHPIIRPLVEEWKRE